MNKLLRVLGAAAFVLSATMVGCTPAEEGGEAGGGPAEDAGGAPQQQQQQQ